MTLKIELTFTTNFCLFEGPQEVTNIGSVARIIKQAYIVAHVFLTLKQDIISLHFFLQFMYILVFCLTVLGFRQTKDLFSRRKHEHT